MEAMTREDLTRKIYDSQPWQRAARKLATTYGVSMSIDGSTPVRIVGKTAWVAETSVDADDEGVTMDTLESAPEGFQCEVIININGEGLLVAPFDSTNTDEFVSMVSERLAPMLAKNIRDVPLSAGADQAEVVTLIISGQEYRAIIQPGQKLMLGFSGETPQGKRVPSVEGAAFEQVAETKAAAPPEPPRRRSLDGASILQSIAEADIPDPEPKAKPVMKPRRVAAPEPDPEPEPEPAPAPPAPAAPAAPAAPQPQLAPVAPVAFNVNPSSQIPTPSGTDPSHVVKAGESHDHGRRGVEWFHRSSDPNAPAPPLQEGATPAPPRPQD